MLRFLLLVILTGCSPFSNKEYQSPVLDAPDEWKDASSKESDEIGPIEWWQAFNDPNLNYLIELGLEYNPDIAIAYKRIIENRELYHKAYADFFPQLFFGFGNDAIILPSEETLFGSNDCFFNSTCFERHQDYYRFGPVMDWEIDLFGHIQYATQARIATLEATKENMRAIQVSLTADIARNYIDLRGYQEQLSSENTYLERLTHRVKYLRERSELNLASLDDINENAELLSEQKILVMRLEKDVESAKQRLATLLGQFDLPIELDCTANKLPLPNTNLDLGVPSNLLSYRPDVRKAEYELAAATFRTRHAISETMPEFVIWGAIGGLSRKLAHLWSYQSLYAILDAVVAMPIFDGGKRVANVAANQAKTDAACYNYYKTMLKAVEEVQLAIYQGNFEKIRELEKESQFQGRAASLERQQNLYDQGLVDLKNLNSAEDKYFQQQRELLDAKIAISLNYINLSKALGGGIVKCCE